MNRILFLKATLSLGFGILLAGCGHETKVDAKVESPPVKVEDVPDVNILQVDKPEQFQLTRVQERRTLDELKVSASVAPDVNRTVPVVSMTSGRAVEIRARLGDDVKKGDLLLVINSPDISQAFSDHQKFQASEVLARKQFERAQILYDKGALAQKDLEVARDTDEKAKVDVSTAAERIRILGADLNHPSPLLEVRAPVSGTIVEQNITGAGAVKSLDNSPNLFTIADLSRVWVVCDVYENNLSQVRIGDYADVRLNAYPDRNFRGRVSNIGRVLDPATRSAKVRLELENPDGIMRSSMFASATFRAQTGRIRPVTPATAILRLHDKDWVFRFEGEKRFRRTEIQAGPMAGEGYQEVLSGLKAGETIVANALQFASATEQ
jgi:cobalt-zinc-cadmium efflux system membrane fusion protein